MKIRLLHADNIILNSFLVKLISKLIILFFLFLCHSSISQSRNNNAAQEQEAEITRVPINSNRYNKIQAHQSQQKQAVIDSKQKNLKELKKLKTEGTKAIQRSQNSSILDDLVNQYWTVQNGIKKAKTEKDLERIIDLEKSSLECRKKYILVFEKLENQETSGEQERLYRAFKKDFNYE